MVACEDEDYEYCDDEFDATSGLESSTRQEAWLEDHYRKRRWAQKEAEMRENMKCEKEVPHKGWCL